MINCILCQKALYKSLTFSSLFRSNYHIHDDCFSLLNKTDYITFPFLEKMISIHVLFPSNNKDFNSEQLFFYYGNYYFRNEKMIERSIVVLIDELIDDQTLILVTKLAIESLLLLTYTNENFLKSIENE